MAFRYWPTASPSLPPVEFPPVEITGVSFHKTLQEALPTEEYDLLIKELDDLFHVENVLDSLIEYFREGVVSTELSLEDQCLQILVEYYRELHNLTVEELEIILQSNDALAEQFALLAAHCARIFE